MNQLLKLINLRYDSNYQSINEMPDYIILDILDMNVELIFDSNDSVIGVELPSNFNEQLFRDVSNANYAKTINRANELYL